MNFRLIIFVASIFVTIFTTNGEEYQKIAVRLHNKFRTQHGSPRIKLDCGLNSIAVRCANYYIAKGKIDHSCSYKGKNGENLFSSSGYEPNDEKSADRAVSSWYNEVKKYDFNHPKFQKGTGHFTQVVWAGSTKLGMGIANKDRRTVVVAIYNPYGNLNYAKSFAGNVKPSKSSDPGKVDEAVENADCGAVGNKIKSEGNKSKSEGHESGTEGHESRSEDHESKSEGSDLQSLPFGIAVAVQVLMRSQFFFTYGK